MQVGLKCPVWLYAHPTMEDMAVRIAERCVDFQTQLSPAVTPAYRGTPPPLLYVSPSLDRQASSRERRVVEVKQSIRWEKFPDGFPNLFIDDVKNMAGKDVIFIASFHSPDVIFEQLSIIYSIPRYLARSFTVILPYFPTGTMERVDTEGQVATAKTLATLLSSTPLTARGPAQIMVFDIHALQERFYFSENVIPRLETAIPLLLRELEKMRGGLEEDNKPAIAFPDDGAFKRFSKQFTHYDTVICYKVRNGDKRIVKVKDGEPRGHHVVIVDDLVQTGGTLIECAKALRNGGASRISMYVTHAVFPNDSWKRFCEADLKLENFWITDSMPHARDIALNQPFRLLSLSDAVADVLLGYDLKQA